MLFCDTSSLLHFCFFVWIFSENSDRNCFNDLKKINVYIFYLMILHVKVLHVLTNLRQDFDNIRLRKRSKMFQIVMFLKDDTHYQIETVIQTFCFTTRFGCTRADNELKIDLNLGTDCYLVGKFCYCFVSFSNDFPISKCNWWNLWSSGIILHLIEEIFCKILKHFPDVDV